jgi:hypothetical protein
MLERYMGEFLDAQHRYGGDIHEYFQVWLNNTTADSPDSFSSWMTNLDQKKEVTGIEVLRERKLVLADGSLKTMRKVTYLKEEERSSYELKIDEQGKCSTNSSALHTTDSKEHPHIFVIGVDGALLVAPYTKGEFNHSSFYGGRPVLSAGRMHFTEGKLTRVENYSGHYQSDDTMSLRILERLYDTMGEALAEVTFTFVPAGGGDGGRSLSALDAMKELQKKVAEKEEKQVRQRRPLESIFVEAKTKGLATPAELGEMEQQLEMLQQSAPTWESARMAFPGLG